MPMEFIDYLRYPKFQWDPMESNGIPTDSVGFYRIPYEFIDIWGTPKYQGIPLEFLGICMPGRGGARAARAKRARRAQTRHALSALRACLPRIHKFGSVSGTQGGTLLSFSGNREFLQSAAFFRGPKRLEIS